MVNLPEDQSDHPLTMTLAEASLRTGLTQNTLRMRMRQGKILRAPNTNDGKIRLLIPSAMLLDQPGNLPDDHQATKKQTNLTTPVTWSVTEAMQEHIATLKTELSHAQQDLREERGNHVKTLNALHQAEIKIATLEADQKKTWLKKLLGI